MSWQFLGTNTLIWQPDTRVQTFPSGLVLVQRSAVCRNTYLTTARGSLTIGGVLPCDSPSTVTVFQFPQAQEIHEGNGFVRFDVSGYGYYGSGSSKEESFRWSTYIVPRITKTFVLDSSIVVNPFDYRATQSVVLRDVVGGVTTLAATWAVESSDASVFGNYQEVTVTSIPAFSVLF